MRHYKDIFTELEEKKTPAENSLQRRKLGRRMRMLARKSSTKMKKKRMRTKRRSPHA